MRQTAGLADKAEIYFQAKKFAGTVHEGEVGLARTAGGAGRNGTGSKIADAL